MSLSAAAAITAAAGTPGQLNGPRRALAAMLSAIVANGIQNATKSKSNEDEREKTYVTYIKMGPAGEFYFGRASGYGTPEEIVAKRDSYHHMNIFGYGEAKLDRWAKGEGAYEAIRGREQNGIDAKGGISSPMVGNRINGIWFYNPQRETFLQESYKRFGDWSLR